jgi:hypothetical protein
MQRFIPLVSILILLLVLGVMFGPGLYRTYTFQRDVEAMLAAARSGNTQGIAAAALPAQQADAAAILGQYLPADYAQKVTKLALTGSTPEGDATRYAIVTCKLAAGDSAVIYQGKLKWVWSGKRWEWDFFGSYAAPYTGPGETRWLKLDEVLPEASVL